MAHIFRHVVYADRTIKLFATQPMNKGEKGINNLQFVIPKRMYSLPVYQWVWWFVYVNAKNQKYTVPLVLSDYADDPNNYCVAQFDVDFGITLESGWIKFSLEAVDADSQGVISHRWRSNIYRTYIGDSLEGNQIEYDETESDIISALIQQVQNKVNSLVGGATPLPVQYKSQMVDHDSVYLYVGTEQGEYTNYWYYWDGSDFIHGGLYASGITVDSVPTQGSTNAVSSGGVYTEIAGLKEDLNIVTGNTVINFTNGKYIATDGDTANIGTLVTHATYAYAVVDCSAGDVFTITGHGGSSPRLFAFLGADADGVRPVLSKATQSADLTNQYITAPENAEKLVVNVNMSFAYRLITGKSIVNVWDNVGKNTVDIVKLGRVILYPNLTNSDDYTAGYKTNTGQINTTSPTYMFTDKIPVNYGETVYFTTPCRYVCAFDANGTVVSASGVDAYNIMSYVVPQGVASIQATFRTADEANFMATTIEGQEYIPYGTPVIDSQYIPHYDTDNSYIALKSKPNYYRVASDSMLADDYLIIDKKMPIKNETVLQFSGNITGEFGGIEFGFTDDISQSDSTHFKLDSTKLYRVTSSPLETDHNLTISGNLSITVTQTYTHLMIDITCNGQKFHNSSGWAPQNKYLYVKVLSAMTDCVLSWTACKSKKNIVIFGDSYVSYSASRWVYYLEENGFDDNVVISGYSGEISENGYQNFIDLMPVLSAQYVVWAYGMNDHDTSSAANETWKQKLDAVIAYCEQNGLTPVLCTIPNVPSYSNTYKNAYVRSFIGTYPVIDFAKAVGSDISSSWYSGMLSDDNVHPTASGAMALYNRAIADFPQLCVKS